MLFHGFLCLVLFPPSSTPNTLPLCPVVSQKNLLYLSLFFENSTFLLKPGSAWGHFFCLCFSKCSCGFSLALILLGLERRNSLLGCHHHFQITLPPFCLTLFSLESQSSNFTTHYLSLWQSSTDPCHLSSFLEDFNCWFFMVLSSAIPVIILDAIDSHIDVSSNNLVSPFLDLLSFN